MQRLVGSVGVEALLGCVQKLSQSFDNYCGVNAHAAISSAKKAKESLQ